MFVFVEDAEEDRGSRRFGLSGVLAPLVIAGVVSAAVLWHPKPRPASTPVAAVPSSPPRCTPGSADLHLDFLVSADSEPLSVRRQLDGLLQMGAIDCGLLIVDDLDRAPSPHSPSADIEARTINAAVEAAICPRSISCLAPRAGTEADVRPIRDVLRALGYPDAEARPAKYVGESPGSDVVFGVPLHTGAGCLVSYAHMGQGVAPMVPVGMLNSGLCLHPAN